MPAKIANLRNYLLEKYDFFDKDLEKIIAEFYYGENNILFQNFVRFCQFMSGPLDEIYKHYAVYSHLDFSLRTVNTTMIVIDNNNIITKPSFNDRIYKGKEIIQIQNYDRIILNYYEHKNPNDFKLDIDKIIYLNQHLKCIIGHNSFDTIITYRNDDSNKYYHFQLWFPIFDVRYLGVRMHLYIYVGTDKQNKYYNKILLYIPKNRREFYFADFHDLAVQILNWETLFAIFGVDESTLNTHFVVIKK